MCHVPIWPGSRPYRPSLSRYDDHRSYVLFDDVESNIPRWGQIGEYGSWNWARGLLVELALALDARPVALRYRELTTRGTGAHRDNPIGVTVRATLVRGPHRINVLSRRESAPYSRHDDYWRLTVAGEVPEDGLSRHPPSLPWIAYMVRRHLEQRGWR